MYLSADYGYAPLYGCTRQSPWERACAAAV